MILLRIAAQQPGLFVMEDLHWVDPSTLELLNLLVDRGIMPIRGDGTFVRHRLACDVLFSC